MKKLLLSALLALTLTGCAAQPLVDTNGQYLPATPIATFEGTVPKFVTAANQTVNIYPYGQAPTPVGQFATIKRECKKLDSTHTECYSSSPFETTLTESDICGFPAAPAVIMSCKANSCVSEIYMMACATMYPDVGPSVYSAPISTKFFGGAINTKSEFLEQSFSTNMDFTSNLNTAMSIKSQGRNPILGLGAMFFANDGTMKATAAQDLEAAIVRFPSLFVAPTIEIYDEPFIGINNATVQSINQVATMIKARLPNASLGMVIAPVWAQYPNMLNQLEAVVHNMQWLAIDPYIGTFNATPYATAVTTEFADYMTAYHPTLQKFLVVQGFGPVGEVAPQFWGSEEIYAFTNYLAAMANLSPRFNGVVVWGWTSVFEVEDKFAGKHFPQAVKDLYINFSR